MKFNGTKGKWTNSEIMNFSDTLVSYIRSENGKDVAQLRGCFSGEEKEALCNAKLISAAPDMLDALQNLENDNNIIPQHAWKMIQDSIKKALT